MSPLLLLLLVWLFTAGCQALSYTSPTGERFVRRTWGVTSTLAVLSVECGTNGVRSIRLQGYQADPSRTMSAVTEAAVRAAIQSLKSQAPIPGT